MSAAPQAVSKAEFARLLGASRSAITAHAKAGRLVLTDDGLVMVEASRARLQATVGAPERAGEGIVGARVMDWRERKEQAQAEMAEMDVAQRRGELVRADEVAQVASAAVVVFRTRLEMLPDQLAPQIAVITDEHRVRALLAAEIESALADLAHRLAEQLAAQAGKGAA